MTSARDAHTPGVKNLESPKVAEAKQRRKLQYLPPVWPVVVALVVIIAIAIAVKH